MAVRSGTTETRTSSDPTQDPNTSAVSDTTVLPEAPYTEEEVTDLALSMSRRDPYFFSKDVRSEESSARAAKELLDNLLEMGYEKPVLTDEAKEVLDASRDPEGGAKAAEEELAAAQAAEKAALQQSSSSSASSLSSSGSSSSSTGSSST